jgi:hypothetical protein
MNKYVEGAIHASSALLNLINDLFDMATIETTVFRLNF